MANLPTTTISMSWCAASVKACAAGAEMHGHHLDLGSALHKAAEAASRAAYAGGSREAAAFAALHQWQLGDRPLPDEWFSQACEIANKMLGPESSIWFGTAGAGRTSDVEMTLCLDEDFRPVKPTTPWTRYGENDPRVAYAATIDRIDYPVREDSGGLEATDYKSTVKVVTKGDADTPQARWYSFVVLQHLPAFGEIKWRQALLRHGYTVAETYTRDDKRLRWARDLMKAKRERMRRAWESGEWRETIGDWCEMCPVRERCEAFIEIASTTKPPEDPSDRVAIMSALKPYVAGLERELKKHADAVGPIPVNPGEQWGYHAAERNELALPVVDVLDALREYGATDDELREWFPGDRVSRARVFKALETLAGRSEDGDLDPEAEILGMWERRPYQTCGVHPRETVEGGE